MDIKLYLLTNLINGIIGIVLLMSGYYVFDRLTPNLNLSVIFSEKGITGASIVVGAYILGLALVIKGAAQ